jgi:hypothetical protein
MKYKEKTAYDWLQVIFSDESNVEISKQLWQITEEFGNTQEKGLTLNVWHLFSKVVENQSWFWDVL